MKPNHTVDLQIRIPGKEKRNTQVAGREEIVRKKKIDDYKYQKELSEILNDEVWNKDE